MQTEALIDSLCAQVQAIPRRRLASQLFGCLAFGAGASLLLLGIAYGVRPDLRTAFFSWPFWMKWTYAMVFIIAGYWLCERMARPGAKAPWTPFLLLFPVLLLMVLSARVLLELPEVTRNATWLGHSAAYCPWSIGLLSMPIFAVLCLTLRRVAAPTQLRWAGFAAGVLSGAIAALIYGLYCTESSVPFVTTWYTLGMLLPALCGALFGPRLLRWS